MILEVADFRIKTEGLADFEAAMEELRSVIASSPGYLGHTLQCSQETPGRYLLLVRWSTLEAHTKGFRGSPAFETWRNRLAAHRDGAVVEHFEMVLVNDWTFAPNNG
jgi:heme-degrading monooxygenase HmoA